MCALKKQSYMEQRSYRLPPAMPSTKDCPNLSKKRMHKRMNEEMRKREENRETTFERIAAAQPAINDRLAAKLLF